MLYIFSVLYPCITTSKASLQFISDKLIPPPFFFLSLYINNIRPCFNLSIELIFSLHFVECNVYNTLLIISGKKFFPVTFIGSIVWIAAYSYLMVWWANVSGDTIKIPPEVSLWHWQIFISSWFTHKVVRAAQKKEGKGGNVNHLDLQPITLYWNNVIIIMLQQLY